MATGPLAVVPLSCAVRTSMPAERGPPLAAGVALLSVATEIA